MTITALPGTPIARLLADAPVGPYPMLEAAFAWAELRPADWRWLGPGTPHATASRYSAVAVTTNADAAARMARLLSAITWAIVRPAGDPVLDSPAGKHALEIQVPSDGYHRTIRALTGAWRDGRRMLGTPAAAAAHRPAALALWRMAIVLHPTCQETGPVTVGVHSPQAAAMLGHAATALALPYVVERGRGGVKVVCGDRRKLFHALTAAPSRA